MGNRKHSKIDQLDPAVKETVDEMIKTGALYREIVDYIKQNGMSVSCRCRQVRKESDEHLGRAASEPAELPCDHGRN